MNELKPLAYGYMRIFCDVTDEKIRAMEVKLRAYAEEMGYEYASVFHEFQSSSYEAWQELMDELQRADAHHVVVPSMNHLARNLIFQSELVSRLELTAKAELHALKDHELRQS